jgi:hypothetical protein
MTDYGSLTHPLCGRYATLDDRLKSHKHAPENLKRLSPLIDEDGFYYMRERESIKYFYCGFSLKEWRGSDEPWVDLAYWTPFCEYLLGNKTKKWIRQAFNSRARLVDGEIPKALPVHDPPSTLKCCICLERDLQIAFLPCGHLCACGMCVPGLKY